MTPRVWSVWRNRIRKSVHQVVDTPAAGVLMVHLTTGRKSTVKWNSLVRQYEFLGNCKRKLEVGENWLNAVV